MYKITDGILEKDGKKVLAIGQSYYPSFHDAKYPVPPEGDRIAEMQKDFRLMKEMGFNHIRVASIGLCALNEKGELIVDTPFVDAMLREGERLDISMSVRIEGYAVNLHEYKDVLMIDENGEPQDTSRWYDFIQTTLSHEGLLEDNVLYAEGKAKHFDRFPNVVGYQVYNEPHFPGSRFFDYHPENIKAYKKWLTCKGIMDKAAAEGYTVPHKRYEDTPELWAYWRLFNRDRLTDFLNTAAGGVKNVSDRPTFTCYTADALTYIAPYRGVDPFGNARYMDIVGYTNYCHAVGSEYYADCLAMENFVHAAETEGKKCWCIEIDSRTTIPPSLFNKNTFATLGSGATGLVYYQWRGDHPSEATPIPNGCGLVNYDGSKTPNYDNAAKTVKLLHDISDFAVEAAPINEHIGIFYSDFALFYCDACQNGDRARSDRLQNEYVDDITAIYTELRGLGYTVKTVDETALRDGKFELDLLFVPTKYALQKSEHEAITAFKENGGTVYETKRHGMQVGGSGYIEFDSIDNERHITRNYRNILLSADEILLRRGKAPAVKSNNTLIAVQTLAGDGYKMLCLTNLTHPTLPQDVTLTCNFAVTSAVAYEVGEPPRTLEVVDNKIFFTDISDGAVIIVN